MAQAKIAKKATNVKLVEKMLHHFQTHNFIKKVSNSTIEFTFITENLKELIRREWVLTNVMASDEPAFLFDSLKSNENLKTAFGDVRNLLGSDSFSIVEINAHNKEIEKYEPKNVLELVSNQFKKKNGTILRSQYFCSPNEGLDVFCKKQREHKLWWRKFSALPARFINSKVSSEENKNTMISEIQAEFPWGFEVVETIKYLPDFSHQDNTSVKLKSSKQKKSLMPQLITCESILENMTFTFLCDSYEQLNGEKERDLMGFNKRLAPFKVAIAGTGDSSETVKNLEELSLLLAKQVRKSGLSVLLLPDACTTAVADQVLRNDALGVPFTILLNNGTLKDGILALRSRDTTLEEQSHVSLVVEYLNKILK